MGSQTILLPTDQVRCYGQTGQVIACDGTGQDASSGKIRLPAADQRFEVHDRIVRDTLTGAVWSRDANPAQFPLTWDEALAFVADMRARGEHDRDDWRLPSRRLLFSLISHQQINPALVGGHPFRHVFTGYYWTADTCRRLPDQAWYVHLGGGRVHRGMKQGSYMVWPVSVDDAADENNIAFGPDRFAAKGPCVHDRLTGLTWSRDANPAGAAIDWQQTLDRVQQLNARGHCGHADWRVPTVRELDSLVSLSAHSPALPGGHPFFNVKDAYWSSTTSVYEPRYAWAVYFQDGIVGVGFKAGAGFYLWPVRG